MVEEKRKIDGENDDRDRKTRQCACVMASERSKSGRGREYGTRGRRGKTVCQVDRERNLGSEKRASP